MVSAISGNLFSSGMQVQQTSYQQSISQDQRQVIEDTLAKYDAENLTQSEASSIVDIFSNAGIQPGRELADAMAEFGFDAKSVGDLAGVGGSHPPSSDQHAQTSPLTLNISDAMLQQLNELLSDYYSDDLSEGERETTLDAIKELFQEGVPEGGLVNVYA